MSMCSAHQGLGDLDALKEQHLVKQCSLRQIGKFLLFWLEMLNKDAFP